MPSWLDVKFPSLQKDKPVYTCNTETPSGKSEIFKIILMLSLFHQ